MAYAFAHVFPQPQPMRRAPLRASVTDEMMIKAMSMANPITDYKDLTAEDSKLGFIQSKVIGINKWENYKQTCMNVKRNDNCTRTCVDVGNTGKLAYKRNCSFELICDFLQSLMQKHYKEALEICIKILTYEPDNEIAKEFQRVLNEIVKDEAEFDNEDGGSECSNESDSSVSSDYIEEPEARPSYTSSSSSEDDSNRNGLCDDEEVTSSNVSGDENGDNDDDDDSMSTTSWCLSSSSPQQKISSETDEAQIVDDFLDDYGFDYDYKNEHNHNDDTFYTVSSIEEELEHSYSMEVLEPSGIRGGAEDEDYLKDSLSVEKDITDELVEVENEEQDETEGDNN